jgi:hypothetical protein
MSGTNFQHPPDSRYFEDYVPEAVHEFGAIAVDEEEVLDFGRRFVPLSYHTDKEAAKKKHIRRRHRQRLAHRRSNDAGLY